MCSIHNIAKLNITINDADDNGVFDANKDNISVNDYQLKGSELKSFFHALDVGNTSKDIESLKVEIEEAGEDIFQQKWASPPDHAKVGFISQELLDAEYHKLDKFKQLTAFLAKYPVISVLEPQYQTVTHSGRCQDGCSNIIGFYLTPKIYLTHLLSASAGGALLTYPMVQLNFDQLNVQDIFGYTKSQICIGTNTMQAWKKNSSIDVTVVGPSLMVLDGGQALFPPQGEYTEGHCN